VSGPSREAVRRRQTRAVAAARGLWGLACLLRPGAVVRAAGGLPDDGTSTTFTRVLGARHLVQAAVTAAHPSAATVRIGVGVDGLHAVTMAGLTVIGRRRLPSLLNALAATGWACSPSG